MPLVFSHSSLSSNDPFQISSPFQKHIPLQYLARKVVAKLSLSLLKLDLIQAALVFNFTLLSFNFLQKDRAEVIHL